MLNPHKNTPSDAYLAPSGFLAITCRPTYFTGLCHAGFSGVAHPLLVANDVTPWAMPEVVTSVACLSVAVIAAQILEYRSRPPLDTKRSGSKSVPPRRDRTSRQLNLFLYLTGQLVGQTVSGFAWNTHTLLLFMVMACTAASETLYQCYGRRHPYLPEQAIRAGRRTSADRRSR